MSAAALLTLALLAGPTAPDSPALRPLPIPPPPLVAFPIEAPPDIPARSWIAFSVDRNAELASKDPDLPVAPASITKVMTAILAVENASLSNSVQVSAAAAGTPIGYVGQADVNLGETWLIRELLSVVMVGSGNRASSALAEGVSGSLESFVQQMNARAAAIGMTNTTFHNPHGLDAAGHITTARDLVKLGIAAMAHPDILHMSRVKAVDFVKNGRLIEIESTNRDLGVYPGFFGIKTGDTAGAGQTLLAYAETQHDRIVAVVLGSPDRRGATRDLIAWASTTLGPREYFLAPIEGSDLALLFPDWYQSLITAAGGVLDPGDPVVPESTPLTDRLDERFRELLPAVLGGDA